jgi:hypothetical protein
LGERDGAVHRRHCGSAAPPCDPAVGGHGGRPGRVFRKLHREPGNERRGFVARGGS